MKRLPPKLNLLAIKLVLSIQLSKRKLASMRVISTLLTGFNTISPKLLLTDSRMKPFMIF